MKVHLFPALDTNYFYLLEENKKAVIFDPGTAQPVLRELEKHSLQPEAIWLTHHHVDHIGGVATLVQRFQIPVYAPAGDLSRLPFPALPVHEGDLLDFQGFSFEVLEIPGHTLNHVAYFCAKEELLFSGDTVFSLGCGRLFEGTPKQMHDSLQKIQNLPSQTLLFFAHEYTKTNLEFLKSQRALHRDLIDTKDSLERIEEHVLRLLESQGRTTPTSIQFEKDNNPFFRLDLEGFTKLRQLRNQW